MKTILLSVILLSACVQTYGQATGKCYRVVVYNVENLFDVRDDSLTLDEDFTPVGKRHWTQDRYNRKLINISQALLAAGDGKCPAFIGLAEVENRFVLEKLVGKTALADGEYQIVHADSPDLRGIDVALLYRGEDFSVLRQSFFPVPLKNENPTRDILYCKGLLADSDTLHFFVAHFPSMRGGETQSEWKRICAAKIVRQKVDSIYSCNPDAAIIIMGDLNGKANTLAQQTMKTKSSDALNIRREDLYNTGYYLLKESYGSYYYRNTWQTIDHVIVSGALLDGKHTLQATPHLIVYRAKFLLEEDKNSLRWKPKPTYRGFRYIGGYSDHLPIYIDIVKGA